MKKLILCLVLTLLTIQAASAEEWLTIQDLRAQTPQAWAQTYETKWRTISVDAAVTIPDVTQLPVMLIEDAVEAPTLTAEETGWDTIRTYETYHMFYKLAWNRAWPDYPSKLDGKRLNSQQEGLGSDYYGGLDPAGCYVPLSETTYSEICNLVDETLLQFGYDPQNFTYRTPFRAWGQHMLYYGKKQDALPGTLFAEFYAKLNGVPVLGHIKKSVISYTSSNPRDEEFWEFPECSIIYHGYGEYLGSISLWLAKPAEVLAQDIPLCSFDTVLAAIEDEINAGHIRKIYEIELGYILYNEPGEYRNLSSKGRKEDSSQPFSPVRYYAKPMWRVNCLWADSAQEKVQAAPSDSGDERNSLNYYQLLLDAQTGEMVEKTSAQDRCEFKGFISWEEIQ